MEEIFCLARDILVRNEEMIGSSHEVVLSRPMEIIVEVLVEQGCAFRCLDDDEANRMVANLRITESVPIYLCLMVTDVNAHDVVTRGIVGFAIERTPTERKRSNEEIIEHEHIGRHHENAAQEQTPPRK